MGNELTSPGWQIIVLTTEQLLTNLMLILFSRNFKKFYENLPQQCYNCYFVATTITDPEVSLSNSNNIGVGPMFSK